MIIKNKVAFVKSVGIIVSVDMGIQNLVFPASAPQKGTIIEYDAATVEGVAPEYNSFANKAKVVSKDGKEVVRLAPVNFNNSISKETIHANAVKFGQNEYGVGSIDTLMQSALTGVGKLHQNARVGLKKIIYEALTTHRITSGFVGVNGAEDIVFNVPALNKEVFDGTIKKYWSNTTSTPLVDVKRAVNAMKVKPRYVIVNDNTYSDFIENAQVLTTDNSSTGEKKNFTINEDIDIEADFFRAGRINFRGVIIDMYVERGVRNTGLGYEPCMANGYVVYAGGNGGSTEFGGIPIAHAGGVDNIAAVYDVQEIIEANPPQHEIIYRSAPLPCIKSGESFFSQKVEA